MVVFFHVWPLQFCMNFSSALKLSYRSRYSEWAVSQTMQDSIYGTDKSPYVLQSNRYWGGSPSLPEVKRPGREADQ